MKRRLVPLAVMIALLVAFSSVAWAAAQPAPTPTGQGRGQRRLQLELAWTAQGILQLDKKPALRITPAQAAKLLSVMEGVQKRLSAETGPAQGNNVANSGQGGAGSWQNLSAADREKLRRQLEASQRALQAALDQIDKILTPGQVEFLDNLDFDETPYLVRRPGGQAGAGVQVGSGGQNSLSPQQLAEARKQAEAAQARLEKLFTQTVDYLKGRAKAKK